MAALKGAPCALPVLALLLVAGGVHALSALEAACGEGDRRACDSLGRNPDDFGGAPDAVATTDEDWARPSRWSDTAAFYFMMLCVKRTLIALWLSHLFQGDEGRAMTRDEHVKTKGSRAYLEDGKRDDYDPETCLVYSEAFAVVRSQACVAEKLGDYFAEDGGYWRPDESARTHEKAVHSSEVCHVHHCNATSYDLADAADPARWKGHLERFGQQGQPTTPVEERIGCPSPEEFYHRYVYAHKPVIMRGCARGQPSVKKWTDEYLRRVGKGWRPIQEMNKVVKRNDRMPHYMLPFEEFIDTYRNETRYMINKVDHEPLRKDILLPKVLNCRRTLGSLEAPIVWMSSGGTKSSNHFAHRERSAEHSSRTWNSPCCISKLRDLDNSLSRNAPRFVVTGHGQQPAVHGGRLENADHGRPDPLAVPVHGPPRQVRPEPAPR